MTSNVGYRALITGASSGIGTATAFAFAEAGIHVSLVSRSQEKLETVADAVRQKGVEAKAYALDLFQLDQVESQIAQIAADFGPIDILVNNAGMGYTGNLASTPLNAWQQVIDLNLTSAFQCIQGVLPGMRDRQQGTIINIASIAGYHAFPGWGAYNVSKAGLITLSKTLAAEESANGIRVMILNPGAVNTPIWDTETVQADFDRTQMLSPEVVAQSILHLALLPQGAVIPELTLLSTAGTL
jgi:short-subunit dehydrogenase